MLPARSFLLACALFYCPFALRAQEAPTPPARDPALNIAALGISISGGARVVGDDVRGSGAMAGHLTLRRMQDHFSHPGSAPTILHSLALDLRANIVGFNGSDFMTGGEFRGSGFIAGATRGGDQTGCAFYVGVSGAVEGSFGWQLPAQEGSLRLQPETGLICRVNGVTFTVTPSSGIGAGFFIPPSGSSRTDGMAFYGGFSAGAIARVFHERDFWMQLEGYMTPNVTGVEGWWTNAFHSVVNLGWRIDDSLLVQWATQVSAIDRLPYDRNPEGAPTALIDSRGTVVNINTYLAFITLF